MQFGNHSGQPIADMNLTPLIDVMMVLMIIFMITSPLDPSGVNLDLPEADADTLPRDDDRVTVFMDASGAITLQVGEQPAVNATLETVTQLLKTRFAGKKEANIKADKGLRYQSVMTLLVRVREAGIKSIGLITAPPPKEATP